MARSTIDPHDYCLTVRLNKEIDDRLKKATQNGRISKSIIVREILDKHLPKA